MPTTMPKGAKRQDSISYPPEGLIHLKLGENISRNLPHMAVDDLLADARIVDDLKLRELAESIAKHGQITPVAIREENDGSGVVVDGARRFLSVALINLDPSNYGLKAPLSLRAIKLIVNDEEAMELNLIANLQRLDLDVIDRAHVARSAVAVYGWTQERIASVMGCSPSSVSILLKFARFPARTQALMKKDGKLTAAAARQLIGLPEGEVKRLTKEMEDGASAKDILGKVKARKRASGDVISRTRAELISELASLSELGSQRAGILMKWLAGDNVSISAIMGDGELDYEILDEEIPPTVLIGGKAVEVHEEAS